jgi:hypothetical protein
MSLSAQLSDVSVTMKEISINDRSCKMEKLNTLADMDHVRWIGTG